MSAFVGMDVAEVLKLGNDLHAQAESLNDVCSRIDALVRRLPSMWSGQDAERFADWWTSQHRPALRTVLDAIEGLVRSARNNAEAQVRISDGSALTIHRTSTTVSSAEAGPFPGGGTSGGSSAAGLGGPSAAVEAVNSFVANYQGHGVDTDNAFGNQCVDLFNLYNREVVGGAQIGTPVTGGARDLYEAFPASAAETYERIPAGQTAQPGDVAVWGATASNQWGHVAMVVSAEPNGLKVFQQNGFNPGGAAYLDIHSYNGLLGYLRPKKFVGLE